MKKLMMISLLAVQFGLYAQLNLDKPLVNTVNGELEGISNSGISIFRGIPYAQPPVGYLRWKAPEPVKNWNGVRKADQFGPRAMQLGVFGDMAFRSNGVSEDCLYLNVWTPAKTVGEKLPVLVYFYGGGFVAGDGSEFRYDGESMARKGIVALTVNYRLGVFGFFAHPELSKETSYHGSGNYGLMDQCAALRWVQQNIAAFGGDPKRVTIAGESAGSLSVSAQMASPLSKNLIAGAIGESGAIIKPTLGPVTLAEGEQNGVKFAASLGATSLADLRAMPAQKLLEAGSKLGVTGFTATVDGYFFPKLPVDIYLAGEQAHVPLLVGWNSEEMNYRMVMGGKEATPENYTGILKTLYGDKYAEALRFYPGSTPEEVLKSATALSGDRFIAYSTWKWYDSHLKTGGSPVYRYYYERPRPALRSGTGGVLPAGAVHSAEIEYAMGTLPTNRVYDWQPEDFEVSAIMQEYFANFIKTGNPNGTGLPEWPAAVKGKPAQVMHINVMTHAEPDQTEERYRWLDAQFNLPGGGK
jgi:para-nitrobenzyl esterase